jgi:pimeloyl-ACP methyl ester carboxylesterase
MSTVIARVPRAIALALAALALLATPALAARHHHRGRKRHPPRSQVRTIPVSFTVVNDNTSKVPCSSDGRTYTISGSLVLPAGPVPSAVTLYVHGLGYARYFWDFTAVPGYDYAGTEASDGHASVLIDRLGYGRSSIPSGTATCVGSQATILHEIIQQLRRGAYAAPSLTSAPTFDRVGLVGHSLGGQLAEVEAYSYNDIDALGVVEWSDDASYSVGAYSAFASDITQCLSGGHDQVGSSTAGYAAFGETTAEYDALMFADVAPAVQTAANALRTLDPCGQIESTLTAIATDALNINSIRVPIAFVHAGDDGIFTDQLPWWQLQEGLYTSSPDVTNISLPGEGHAVTLERSAPKLQAAMNAWLTANGL